jgi:hypothetical protein
VNRDEQLIVSLVRDIWTDLHALRKMTKWGSDSASPYLYRVVHNLIDEGRLECRGGWEGGAFMVRSKR